MVVGVTTATPRGANWNCSSPEGENVTLGVWKRSTGVDLERKLFKKFPDNHLLSDSAECLLEGY